MIPTIQLQSLFWQGLARGDYFGTSVKISEADICNVVGEIADLITPKLGAARAFTDPNKLQNIRFRIHFRKRLSPGCHLN